MDLWIRCLKDLFLIQSMRRLLSILSLSEYILQYGRYLFNLYVLSDVHLIVVVLDIWSDDLTDSADQSKNGVSPLKTKTFLTQQLLRQICQMFFLCFAEIILGTGW